MVYQAHVIYPNEDDATFKMDYYLSTHMPLVMKSWGKYGLQKWDVIEYGPGADGAKPPYSVCAILTWGSQEEMGKAMSSEEAGPVFGDIPNFSNKGPTLMAGSVVATS